LATISTLREVCFVPSEGIVSLFYSIFDLSPSIVDRNYLFCFYAGVGHNKSDTRKESTNMPLDLADNPSGLIPTFRPILEFDHLDLQPAFRRTTDGASRSVEYVPLEIVVGGDADEIADSVLFTKLVQVGTGKGCIPPQPELLEPRSVAVNKR
jgi:hypothetical protein